MRILTNTKISHGQLPWYYHALRRLMHISENTAMFSILGTIYSGDGRTTFALPNLKLQKNATAPHGLMHYIICLEGILPSRS